jgi:hypothetical protein
MSAKRSSTWTNYSEVVSTYSESTAESEPSYLTVAQLAQRLQVTESTIYGWFDRDYIPFLIAGVDVVKIKEFDGTRLDCDNHALHSRDRPTETWRDCGVVRV